MKKNWLERLGEDRRGIVLAECVLVLPIYIALLGGLFWIGDAGLCRNMLVCGEQYYSWHEGLRHSHGNSLSQIENTYFKNHSAHKFKQVVPHDPDAYEKLQTRWHHRSAYNMTADFQAWEMLTVMLNTVYVTDGRKDKIGNKLLSSSSGGSASNETFTIRPTYTAVPNFTRTNSVLMRSSNPNGRNQTAGTMAQNSDLLGSKLTQRFLYEDSGYSSRRSGVRRSSDKGKEYRRFGQYITWSE